MLMDDINNMLPATYYLIGIFSIMLSYSLFFTLVSYMLNCDVNWLNSLLAGIAFSIIVSLYTSFTRSSKKKYFSLNEFIWTASGCLTTVIMRVLTEIVR